MEEIKKILTFLNHSIHSQALSDALAASELNEVEWKEEDITDIETQVNALMTEEAAIRNKNVIGVIKDDPDFKGKIISDATPLITKNILDKGEHMFISKLGRKFDVKFPAPEEDDDGKAKSGYLYQLIKFLETTEIKNAPDEEITQRLQDKEDRITELMKNSKIKEEEYENTLKDFETTQVQKEINRAAFNTLSNNYTWAQNGDVKELIIADRLNKAAAKIDLKIEDGEILLYDKGKDTRLMEGNKYVTFTDYFEPKISGHLKTKDDPPPKTPAIVVPGDKTEKDKRNIEYRRQQEETFGHK